MTVMQAGKSESKLAPFFIAVRMRVPAAKAAFEPQLSAIESSAVKVSSWPFRYIFSADDRRGHEQQSDH
jgi:hypothetical protein